MHHATDSSPVLFRQQTLGTRESEILTCWAGTDDFLEAVAARIDAHRGSGADPPPCFAWIPAAMIVGVIDDLLAPVPEVVNRRGAWFLVMAYLEARQEPRRWYSLSDDEASCLSWMFPVQDSDRERHEDDELGPRELVALYLYERSGRAPDWFQPMPEA